MKGLLFILLALLVFRSAAQTNMVMKPAPTYYTLTAEDKKHFVLSVDRSKVSTQKYVTSDAYGTDAPKLMLVPVRLTNSSKDTLKYISMWCSWEDFYKVDNIKAAHIDQKACEKNFPIKVIVLPGESTQVMVPVIKGMQKGKFRIGLLLLRCFDKGPYFDFQHIDDYRKRNESSNTIWSNEIELL